MSPTVPIGVPLIGQPFTLRQIAVPVNAVLSCNCGGDDTTVTVLLSAAAACPSCGKVYNLALNPTTSKIEVSMSVPAPGVAPS